ncbi:hypothetical protein [Absidia glauca]|uniref:Peptidase A2 domain-containing protein n=1 Tax=Absidia glauca TaxID=4829 RepID=A0A168N9B2_ABSGL|nr:hypothetical protein [Absidia glauca]
MFSIMLLLNILLYNDIVVAYHSRTQKDSRPQTVDQVLALAAKINRQKRSWDSDEEGPSNSKVAKRRHTAKDTFPKRNLQCSYHGHGSSHTSADCRMLNAGSSSKKSLHDSKHAPGKASKARNSDDAAVKPETCWFCKLVPFTSSHMCEQRKESLRRRNGDTAVRSIKVKHPADQAMDRLHNTLQSIQLQAFDDSMDTGNTPFKLRIRKITDSPHRTNKPYVFPLLLQNERAFALLDTGADVSVISKSFIDVNKIQVCTKNPKPLQLAGKDNTLMGLGNTVPILVSFNNVTLKHQFVVIELEEGIDCYIGDDLINLFNITVSNIPHHWPDQKLEPAKENHNIDNPPEPNNSPAGTTEDHQNFMDAIQPYTDKNQMIPKTSFCPLDISIIRLETPTMPTNRTNHRQYPIALTLQPLVDEAVATWKADGTIVDAPIDTTWNSPITLAPKKDEHGNVTGHRPCLDPRHINKHLPDDVYPLPLIKDIFESMHGATVFTTLDLKSAFHRFKIHPDDQHKTTFTHRGRQYMFQEAPFGLKPLSAKFQRVMHTIFHGLPYVQTFIDDVVVYSPDLSTHTCRIQQV